MEGCPVDGWAVFAAIPTPCVLLTPGLVICEVNDAFLRATERTRDALLGRPIFEAFPDNPGDPAADGTRVLRASLERARDTGRPDTMAVQRYDIPLPDGSGERWAVRYWSPVNTPVLDDAGRTVLLIHRVEDVTDYVERIDATDAATSSLRARVTSVEADLVTRARELQAANEALRGAHERERSVALTLQEAMLPARPTAPGLDVAVRYLPASREAGVGGDWYDVVELGRGRVGIAVGDVVGHGLAAAGVMGQMRSALSAALQATRRPAAALEVLDTVARSLREGFVATALSVVVDVRTGTVRYSSAGHPPPVLLAAGTTALDGATGPGLGITEAVEPRREGALRVDGGLLVLYTDGLVERRGEDPDAGLDRLRRVLAGCAGPAPDVEAVADRLLGELLPGGRGEDDVALVVVGLADRELRARRG